MDSVCYEKTDFQEFLHQNKHLLILPFHERFQVPLHSFKKGKLEGQAEPQGGRPEPDHTVDLWMIKPLKNFGLAGF